MINYIAIKYLFCTDGLSMGDDYESLESPLKLLIENPASFMQVSSFSCQALFLHICTVVIYSESM